MQKNELRLVYKCYQQNVSTYVYLLYMYKEVLALNNPQWLIWHKTKPNQTNHAIGSYSKACIYIYIYRERERDLE